MIELSGIHHRFGAREVLRDISLRIGTGESIAVIGESGSGKTTLGRIVLRLLDPGQGSYQFDGQDVLALRGAALRSWRHNVQAVFQNPWQSLNPKLSIGRLLTEPAQASEGLNTRQRRARAGELLQLVGLPADYAQRHPRQLSGGQRQRVAIARAISIRPRLLVLDEPVSALDMSLRAQILTLLRSLTAESGTSVLYITHDLATVSYLCERAYVLYNGTAVEELPVRQLAAAPDNPYTQLLRSSVLAVGQQQVQAATVAAQRAPAGPAGPGCVFARRCPHAQDICVRAEPAPVTVGPGWVSRCHFAGALKPAPPASLPRPAWNTAAPAIALPGQRQEGRS